MTMLGRVLLVVVLLASGFSGAAAHAADEPIWFRLGAEGQPIVRLLVFHAETCPHCRRALQDLATIETELPWVDLETYEVGVSPENAVRYARIAGQLGEDARYVPAFAFCGTLWQGYDEVETTGRTLRRELERCHGAILAQLLGERAAADVEAPAAMPVHLPVVGTIDPKELSLPILTLVLAGLDAFNPCAFFVLLFLLSLLVHVRSRGRMLLIGGLFVMVSGLVYFLFMAAWLNLFVVVGHLGWVTAAAGLIAITIGGLNVKDFIALRAGPSLSIPEGRKPGLYARIRSLNTTRSLVPALIGTVTLAILVNTYELLCTAGFPMVYTRALTLHAPGTVAGYFWLGLYNLVYILPMLVIIVVFTWTLGSRRLSERGGRLLKLLSGLMMLGLGSVLLIAPHALDRPTTALILVAGAVVLTLLAARWVGPERGDRDPTSASA